MALSIARSHLGLHAMAGLLILSACSRVELEDTSGSDTQETGDTDTNTDTDAHADTDSDSQSPCEWGEATPGQSLSLELSHDGVPRSYQIHLPSDYDCTPRPILIGLHGYYGSGQGFEQSTSEMFDRIDEKGWIGLFPDGLSMSDSGQGRWVTSFNDIDSHNSDGPDGPTCTQNSYDYGVFDNCPPEESQDACNWGTACSDDEGFLRALITKATTEWSGDPKRVYLTGFSQGGQTTQALAWRMADVLAAAAPQHGFAANGYTQAPTTPMGLFQVWASNDRVVNGNDTPSSDGMIYDGADETLEIWATQQGCSEAAEDYPTPYDGNTGWTCKAHTGCTTGAEVVSCVWTGRHTWGNRNGENFALESMLDFFERHVRP